MAVSVEAGHEHCAHHDAHHDLILRDVAVHYHEVCAVRGVNVQISCGNRLALIGPNGAGKSSLLKAIVGLVDRAEGGIAWRGTEVKRWSREFAYLPQREDVDWDFPVTVRGLVEMGRYPQLGFWRRFRKLDAEAVDEALERMQMQDLQKRQIRELSGGQQQRAFIARSLAQEAHVLLLDEPFTGLDRQSSAVLGELLHALSREGRLIVASHHDLSSVESLFNQTLLLAGEQRAVGPTAEVLRGEAFAEVFGER